MGTGPKMERTPESTCMNCLKVCVSPILLLCSVNIIYCFHGFSHSMDAQHILLCSQSVLRSALPFFIHAPQQVLQLGKPQPCVVFLNAPLSCGALQVMALRCCRGGQGVQPGVPGV